MKAWHVRAASKDKMKDVYTNKQINAKCNSHTFHITEGVGGDS